MRTTVNLDEHLLAEAKVLAARQHRTLGAVIDDALRRSFATESPLRSGRVRLPVDGDPNGRLLVDLDDKEAIAELLGDNEWPRADR